VTKIGVSNCCDEHGLVPAAEVAAPLERLARVVQRFTASL
jgi:hypothetical protein